MPPQMLTIHNAGQDYVKTMTCEADYCVGSGNDALHYVDCSDVSGGDSRGNVLPCWEARSDV